MQGYARLCHRLWTVTLTELGCAGLCRAVYGYGLYGLLSELGCAGLCKAVPLMALYVYWAVFSVFWGDDV